MRERGVALVWLLFLLGSVSLPALAGEEKPPEAPPGVKLTWGVKIPLRDGVHLNATLYQPADASGPLPVIFTLTPYISDSYHERAYYFARHGYAFALVDVRGRGNSEGRFTPFLQEGADGHDVVEWLAAQPWSNGQVTMWGGSYAGFDQWMTLKQFPSHLVTIVPAAAAHAGVDFPFEDNIPYPYEMQWLTLTSGVTGNSNLFGESSFWVEKWRELYLSHQPFSTLDTLVGNPSPIFHTWLEHLQQDSYWDQMTLTPEEYARINIPILTITGIYDGDQAGALTYYREHMRYGSAAARAQHYLIIGPWDHAGTRTPKAAVGGLTFGPASLLDLNQLHRQWYDWVMKGGPRPEFLKQRVAYYVTGAEEWKYADSLEEIPREWRKLYLHSDGQANDAFHSGTLTEAKPAVETPDHYVYDPLDTRPGEREQAELKAYLTDQGDALNLFGNGVVYHSEPFAGDTEITGQVRFAVWMALDVPDTDFEATLYEIQPDGTSVLLTQDHLRARYRASLRRAKPVEPGVPTRYEFRSFSFFSRRIQQGSRLRLVLKCPNTIYLEKNYNSGGMVAEESAQDARTAHVTVYHDAEHPAVLELPVVN